jgi:hypothetical protein
MTLFTTLGAIAPGKCQGRMPLLGADLNRLNCNLIENLGSGKDL